VAACETGYLSFVSSRPLLANLAASLLPGNSAVSYIYLFYILSDNLAASEVLA
jgi:hypothetical protein